MTDEDRESEMAPDSFSFDEQKSLAQWRFELRTLPKKHWNLFYRTFLGVSISKFPLFYRALNMYDGMIIFEAIIAASKQEIVGDPLMYVLKIAHSMWREEQDQIEQNAEVEKEIKLAVAESEKHNKELADKLKRLKD